MRSEPIVLGEIGCPSGSLLLIDPLQLPAWAHPSMAGLGGPRRDEGRRPSPRVLLVGGAWATIVPAAPSGRVKVVGSREPGGWNRIDLILSGERHGRPREPMGVVAVDTGQIVMGDAAVLRSWAGDASLPERWRRAAASSHDRLMWQDAGDESTAFGSVEVTGQTVIGFRTSYGGGNYHILGARGSDGRPLLLRIELREEWPPERIRRIAAALR